jgi:hypothetical protein
MKATRKDLALQSVLRRIQFFFTALGPLVTLLTIIVWGLIIFRAMPVPFADFGMFTTVADRLNSGDTLYTDVFENKDPFTHYILAIVRRISPIAAWPLHVSYLLLACIAVLIISRRVSASVRQATFLGMVCAPIVLTGSMFGPGTSHMLGIAICLWVVALSMKQSPVIIGLLLGLLPFIKIVMFPIAIAIAICDLCLIKDRRSPTIKLFLGLFSAVAIASAVVSIRGEFFPWLSALRWNAGYASALAPASMFESVTFHLSSVLVPTTLLVLIAGVLLCLIYWALRKKACDPTANGQLLRLFVISLASGLVGLIVVALTGLWPHHGLVFMIPLCLSLVMFSITLRHQLPRMDGNVFLVTGAAALLLSGIPSPRAFLDPILFFRANAAAYFEASVEAKLIMSTGTPTSYARVGGGNGPNHAYGLRDWKLACPFFTQFTWESSSVLGATLNCLPRAKVILVEAELPRNTNYPDWNQYIRSVDNLLRSEYSCRVVAGAKVCRK